MPTGSTEQRRYANATFHLHSGMVGYGKRAADSESDFSSEGIAVAVELQLRNGYLLEELPPVCLYCGTALGQFQAVRVTVGGKALNLQLPICGNPAHQGMIQELQTGKPPAGVRPNQAVLHVAQAAPRFAEELGRVRAGQAEQFEQNLMAQGGGPLAEAGEFHGIAPDRPRAPQQGLGLKSQPTGQIVLWTAIALAIVFGGIALFIFLAAQSRQ